MNRLVKGLLRPGQRRPASSRTSLAVETLEQREVLSRFTMGGAIAVEYAATARETDASGHSVQRDLGALTSNEKYVPGMGTSPGSPRMNTFQGGAIYWSPRTGAHVVFGGIASKYNSVGGPSAHGLPTSDERNVPGLSGARVSYFQNGNAIYWSQASGAHIVYGAIGAEYTATAGERDGGGTVVQTILGAPTSDEMDVPGVSGARMNTFQRGTIYWSAATNAHVVFGGIGGKYNSLGGPATYGLPILDEVSVPGVALMRVSFFQNGGITWSPATGTLAMLHPTAKADYSPTQGTLFGPGGPSFRDVQQGDEGDCWLLASLAAAAARSPADITSMFTLVGTTVENTAPVSLYAVRFYDPNGNPQYVVVDTELPSAGSLDDHPVNDVLWAALAEKAYAEANGAGFVTTGNPGQDSYHALYSGWPEWGFAAILGKSASRESSINPSDVASAWNQGKFIALDTANFTPADSRIWGGHSYALVGYDASSSSPFQIYNPYGTDANGWVPGWTNTAYGLLNADATFLSQNFGGATFGVSTGAANLLFALQPQDPQHRLPAQQV
jgi:hypothetical protein